MVHGWLPPFLMVFTAALRAGATPLDTKQRRPWFGLAWSEALARASLSYAKNVTCKKTALAPRQHAIRIEILYKVYSD